MPTPLPIGTVRLRDATREEIVRLAQARAWIVGPKTLKALGDRYSPERQKVEIVDRLVLPGSIAILVDPTLPRGYVIPRGPLPTQMAKPPKHTRSTFKTLTYVALVLFVLLVVTIAFLVFVLPGFEVAR